MGFMQNIGWLLFLAAVILLVGMMTKSLIVATWEAASQGKQLDGDEAFRAFFGELRVLLDIIFLRKTAAVCSAVVCALFLFTGVDFWATAGFASMTFVIVGYAVPAFQRRVRPLAASNSASAHAEVRKESELD